MENIRQHRPTVCTIGVSQETHAVLAEIQSLTGQRYGFIIERLAKADVLRLRGCQHEPGGPLEGLQRHAAVCLDCAVTYPAALGACPYCGRKSERHPPRRDGSGKNEPIASTKPAAGAPLKQTRKRTKALDHSSHGGRGGLGSSVPAQTIPGGRVVGWECPNCHAMVDSYLGDCPRCAADCEEDQT